jgi:hypothetical protein
MKIRIYGLAKAPNMGYIKVKGIVPIKHERGKGDSDLLIIIYYNTKRRKARHIVPI